MPSLATMKWIGIGLLAAVLIFVFQQNRIQAGRIDSLKAERDDAVANAEGWRAHAAAAQELAGKTIEARAQERQDIVVIRDAAGTAKGEIAHAPGADDRFRYSDPAYRFMRAQPREAEATAGTPAPDVE